MARNTVVLAFFQSEAEADDAAEQMKEWDKWEADVKLNAMGVLALDDNGKIKTHKLGRRSVGKGAGIGLLLAIIAPPTLLAGVVGGGILGALHHKNLGIKGEDQERIAAHLAGGRAARRRPRQGRPGAGRRAASDRARWDDGIPSGRGGRRGRGRRGRSGGRGRRGRGRGRPDDHRWCWSCVRRGPQGRRDQDVRRSSRADARGIAGTLARGNAPLIAGQTADTWPRQAKLAAAGDWSALRRYIDSKK